ncbi:MAG: YARHG domain-containing protein [Armatimonadetes bacterium]|nr:YARHG domain-containing protein [Armatimonadota bacterium]
MRHIVLLCLGVLFISVALSGCGFITSRLPRIRIEPPPAQEQKKSSEQVSEDAKVPPDSVADDELTESGTSRPTPEPVPTEGPTTSTDDSPAPAPSTGAPKPPAPAPKPPPTASRYVPLGSKRTLTTSDLAGRSAWQLDVLRNEIYAVHGRPFTRADLRRHFRSQWWYHEDSRFSEARLSSLEKRNADFIAKYQKGRGQTTSSSSSGRRTSGSSGGYVLSFSSSRQVTSSDLRGLSSWQLDIARNEIYARHGRPFKRADLRNYFRSKSWYREDPRFTEGRLSSLEKRNAEFIRQHQH